ncbi:MAG: tRNA 2-selenouridine(34) synthase MnmH [Bacteroidetes bacterium]|nr:tRNA 2-selenouridine(34) synthase MnmH [Bacteroidota bacterium]
MIRYSDIDQIAGLLGTIPVIDVRSPAEFSRGHITGAYNIPLLSDDERARIGLMYNKSGRDSAVFTGLEFVGPRIPELVREALVIAKGKQLIIHCWRGGMRSEAMAWLLDVAGLNITVIKGGYKAYRRFIRQDFLRIAQFVVIGGMTGSGKTLILNALKTSGEQIIDLEDIAKHKGSAFGSLGLPGQPTNEQFENDLHWEWMNLDLSRTTWIEDESQSIGFDRIPDVLFAQLLRSPLLILETEKSQRIDRLEKEYANMNQLQLKNAVLRISKRLGGVNTKIVLEAIEQGDFRKAIEIVLSYYDKTYTYSIESRINQPKLHLLLETDNPSENADQIRIFYQRSLSFH